MGDNIRVVADATCTFCGCVCDDMVLTVDLDQKRITKSENACVLGKAWFKEHAIEDRPFALVDGREATHRGGGGGGRADPGQRPVPDRLRPVGHDLRGAAGRRRHRRHGRRLPRYDDLGLPRPHRDGVPGRRRRDRLAGRDQEPGRPGRLLGREPGGGASPAVHPLRGDAPRGCSCRTGGRTAPSCWWTCGAPPSTPVADIFLQVKPRTDFEVLWALRALVKGRKIDPSIEQRTGRVAAGAGGPGGPDEAVPVRRAPLRHGADHDPRQALQRRRASWPWPPTSTSSPTSSPSRCAATAT